MAGLIDTAYLEDTDQAISMVPGEAITVFRRDGIVVSGYPGVDNLRGHQLPAQSLWFVRVAQGGGSYMSQRVAQRLSRNSSRCTRCATIRLWSMST